MFAISAGVAWGIAVHYNRILSNQYPKDLAAMEKLRADRPKTNWKEYRDPALKIYHGGDKVRVFKNSKTGMEAVYNVETGLPVLSPQYIATPNFASNPAGHAVVDVSPYLLLGNTPTDPTFFYERMMLTGKSGMMLLSD